MAIKRCINRKHWKHSLIKNSQIKQSRATFSEIKSTREVLHASKNVWQWLGADLDLEGPGHFRFLGPMYTELVYILNGSHTFWGHAFTQVILRSCIHTHTHAVIALYVCFAWAAKIIFKKLYNLPVKTFTDDGHQTLLSKVHLIFYY